MKKLSLLFVFLIICNCLTYGQKSDPKATETLKAIGTKYKAYQTIKAVFQVNMENPQGKVTETHTGTLYLKGNKFKIELQNQEIICDSKTIWTFLKDANEVQVNDYVTDENTINPAQIFTLYEKNFLYAVVDDKTVNGKIIESIDLTPNDKGRNYSKVRITIDKTDKSITRATIFGKDASRVIYEMQKLTPNTPMEDSFFTFDKKAHPGVDEENLRDSK